MLQQRMHPPLCCTHRRLLTVAVLQYQNAQPHEAELSHELIAGAASYEVRLRDVRSLCAC